MLALIEIVLLWGFILWTITHFYPISRTAAYLLIPYIVWVSFAAILNFSIFMLNKA
jgi:tryptophan-rich sensory protein